MSKRRRPTRAWSEAEGHPIAWFSALLRGVADGDGALIDKAQDRLERLGYFVVPMPPQRPGRAGVAE